MKKKIGLLAGIVIAVAIIIYGRLVYSDVQRGAEIIIETNADQVNGIVCDLINELKQKDIESAKVESCEARVKEYSDHFKTKLGYNYVCEKAAYIDEKFVKYSTRIDEIKSN